MILERLQSEHPKLLAGRPRFPNPPDTDDSQSSFGNWPATIRLSGWLDQGGHPHRPRNKEWSAAGTAATRTTDLSGSGSRRFLLPCP